MRAAGTGAAAIVDDLEQLLDLLQRSGYPQLQSLRPPRLPPRQLPPPRQTRVP